MTKAFTSYNDREGFTLAELMIAVSLSSMVVAMVMIAGTSYQKVFRSQQMKNEMQQNVRYSMNILSKDLRMAGYGLYVDDAEVQDWIDWAEDADGAPVTMTGNPTLVDNGTSYEVHMAAAYDDPVGTLSVNATNGITTITLAGGADMDEFNTTDKKVICIGKIETARISGKSGNVLTISTHPSVSQGLEYDHMIGEPVEVVKVHSYFQEDDTTSYPFEPNLKRIDPTGSYPYQWQKVMAGFIEDLEVIDDGDILEVKVTGRSSTREFYYTHPTEDDSFRRYTLTGRVHKRN